MLWLSTSHHDFALSFITLIIKKKKITKKKKKITKKKENNAE
jgi:hypothetical protein